MKPSHTDVCNFLRKCFFNPRKLGPLTIISDIGNSEYYEMRAVEFIKEAPWNMIDGSTVKDTMINHLEKYDDKIIKAIQLLVLARQTRYNDAKVLLEKNDESIKE
jgi:hypothetical protein